MKPSKTQVEYFGEMGHLDMKGQRLHHQFHVQHIFTVVTFQTCLDLQPVPPMLVPAAQEGNQQLYVSPLIFHTDPFQALDPGAVEVLSGREKELLEVAYVSLSSFISSIFHLFCPHKSQPLTLSSSSRIVQQS